MNLDDELRQAFGAKADALNERAPGPPTADDARSDNARNDNARNDTARNDRALDDRHAVDEIAVARGRQRRFARATLAGLGLTAAAALLLVALVAPPRGGEQTQQELQVTGTTDEPATIDDEAEAEQAVWDSAERAPDADGQMGEAIVWPLDELGLLSTGHVRCRSRQIVVNIPVGAAASADCTSVFPQGAFIAPPKPTEINWSPRDGLVRSYLTGVDCPPTECRAPLEIGFSDSALSELWSATQQDSAWAITGSTDEWLYRGRRAVVFEGTFDDPVVGTTKSRVFLLEVGSQTLVLSASEQYTNYDDTPIPFVNTLTHMRHVLSFEALDAAGVDDFGDGCPEIGGATIADLDGDGRDEMVDLRARTGGGRFSAAEFYASSPGCNWVPVMMATFGAVSLGDGYFCESNPDGSMRLIDWRGTLIQPVVSGTRVDTPDYVVDDGVAVIEADVWRLRNSKWSLRDSEFLGMPSALPTESCRAPQPAPTPTQIVFDTACTGPPDARLGESIFVDLDRDGRLEVIGPALIEADPAGTLVWHTVWVREDVCSWQQAGSVAQLRSTRNAYLRWGCHVGSEHTSLVSIAASSHDLAAAEYAEVIEWSLVDGSLVEADRFAYDNTTMADFGTAGCEEPAATNQLRPNDDARQAVAPTLEPLCVVADEVVALYNHPDDAFADPDGTNNLGLIGPGSCPLRASDSSLHIDGMRPVQVLSLSDDGPTELVNAWVPVTLVAPPSAVDSAEAAIATRLPAALSPIVASDEVGEPVSLCSFDTNDSATCVVVELTWSPLGDACTERHIAHWNIGPFAEVEVTRDSTGQWSAGDVMPPSASLADDC